MKALVIMQGVPHPFKGASQVVYFSYIFELITAGFEVLTISCDVIREKHESSIAECNQAINNKNFRLLTSEQKSGFTIKRFRISSCLSDTHLIRTHAKEFSPHVVIAFDLASAEIVMELDDVPKIVWLGDMLFQSTWYNYLYGFKEDWKTIRWLPYVIPQYFQWQKHYSRILRSFNKIIVSSKSSEKALEKLSLKSTFYPYPWPNRGSLDHDVQRVPADKPTYLFFGNLVGLGSRSSLHFLFEKLYPELKKLWGDNGFRVIIGGSLNLRDWAEQYISSHPEVKFEGFIDDLLEKMAVCHAVLVPIDVPVGNRSRILTAISKRALVIAHENAALGNPSLVDNETVLLAKDAYEFADKMRVAFEQKEQCLSIINQAEKMYEDNYKPEIASGFLIDEIKMVVNAYQ